MVRRFLGFALGSLALVAVLFGCASPSPADPPPTPLRAVGIAPPPASGSASSNAEDERYVAYTMLDQGVGGLFLWDELTLDVTLLNGALSGLNVLADVSLQPRVFAGGKKLLFTVGAKAFFWDMKTEERTTPVTDGRAALLGGPQAVVTPDGKWIAYVSKRETLVLKRVDGPTISKTVEPSQVAAEGVVLDLDMTADGTLLILNIDGRIFLFDVLLRQLALITPLDAEALGRNAHELRKVAVSPLGSAFASSWNTGRVLLLDPTGRIVETLPVLGADGERIVDLYFLSENVLILETECRGNLRVWRYDRLTGLLRGLVSSLIE